MKFKSKNLKVVVQTAVEWNQNEEKFIYKLSRVFFKSVMYFMNSQKPLYNRPQDLQNALEKQLNLYTKNQTASHARHSQFSIFSANIRLSLKNYLERIFEFINCSSSCFIIAMILIKRILDNQPQFKLNPKNIHKFFFTALVVALKVNDDLYFHQIFYSKVAGIKEKDLNSMEYIFVRMLNYDISVSLQQFEDKVSDLEKRLLADKKKRKNEKTKKSQVQTYEERSTSKSISEQISQLKFSIS